MGNCLFLCAQGRGIGRQVHKCSGVCPGGMVTGRIEPRIKNRTVHCSERAHIAPYRTAENWYCTVLPSEEVTIIAGSGREGNSNGKTNNPCFSHPMGICMECDQSIFVTIAQTRGVLQKKLGRGVRPASQNPYPIYDQNLRFSLPYL